PDRIQGAEHGRGIGGTATETATRWNALFNADVGTLADVERRLQQIRCANAEVRRFRHVREAVAMADDPTVGPRAQVHSVAPVEDAEDGLQLVVAVVAAAGDVQEQVELRRRGPRGPCGRA